MEEKQLIQTIQGFIRAQARESLEKRGVSERHTLDFKGEKSLLETGIFDSVGFLVLLEKIEARFEVEIDLSEHKPIFFSTMNGLSEITFRAIKSRCSRKDT